jgi:hypothetical protein
LLKIRFPLFRLHFPAVSSSVGSPGIGKQMKALEKRDEKGIGHAKVDQETFLAQYLFVRVTFARITFFSEPFYNFFTLIPFRLSH